MFLGRESEYIYVLSQYTALCRRLAYVVMSV